MAAYTAIGLIDNARWAQVYEADNATAVESMIPDSVLLAGIIEGSHALAPDVPAVDDGENDDDLSTFEIELTFTKRCVTRGWTMTGKDAQDAIARAESCVSEDGEFDEELWRRFGGGMSSWDTLDGEESNYEVDHDTVEEVEA